MLFLVLFFTTTAAAQTYKLETLSSPAPEPLAAAVRETLAGEAIRVVGPAGPLCEIWLRKTVPAKANAAPELGVAYGQLAEGTLVGAIRFLSATSDYRRQRIKPEVYTLRYAVQPVDGNHMGVAPNRDFLLLVLASADSNSAALATTELLALSRKATGTSHPSVWSLLAAEGASDSVPVLAHKEEEDLWVLYFRVQLQPENQPARPLVMALVVLGHAPEA